MINAERILATLDKGLDHPVTRVIYDRAALALGFENPPEAPSPLRSAGALQNPGTMPLPFGVRWQVGRDTALLLRPAVIFSSTSLCPSQSAVAAALCRRTPKRWRYAVLALRRCHLE